MLSTVQRHGVDLRFELSWRLRGFQRPLCPLSKHRAELLARCDMAQRLSDLFGHVCVQISLICEAMDEGAREVEDENCSFPDLRDYSAGSERRHRLPRPSRVRHA